MSIKITEKDKKVLTKALQKSLNGIDNIYKFEGYLVGMICSEDMIPPSAFMNDMFGGPDDEGGMEWEFLKQLNEFMEVYSKLNNKNATKLQSHIYRPIFIKTKEQAKDYAYGFRASYDASNIVEDGDYDANLAYMVICSIYRANEEMCKDDVSYANLVKALKEKPVLMLSEAVHILNQIRLENYVAPKDTKDNVLNFEDINSTYH